MWWKNRVHWLLGLLFVAPLACQFEVEANDSRPSDDSQFRGDPPLPGGDFQAPGLDSPGRADPFRSLLVRDPSVVRGPVASSELSGPLSFRAIMQWLVGGEARALPATREWLGQWETATKVGAYAAPVVPRPQINSLLIEPWFSSRPSTPPPGTGPYYEASPPRPDTSLWERAPFRLIAVVNRFDLGLEPCSGSAGEIRFVYAVLDRTLTAPLEMTVIVEIPYPETRLPVAWARAWQELPLLADERHATALGELARDILREADPYRARVRTNEAALGGGGDKSWELREFHVEDGEFGRRLLMNTLDSTPREDVDPKSLATHIVQNAEEIGLHAVSLPEALQGAAARTPRAGFTWAVPGVEESLRTAFSRQTCNGCHGGDTPALPFQHIAADPSLDGPALLSRFLSDPASPMDELRRRQRHLEQLLASKCADDAGTSPYAPTR